LQAAVRSDVAEDPVEPFTSKDSFCPYGSGPILLHLSYAAALPNEARNNVIVTNPEIFTENSPRANNVCQ